MRSHFILAITTACIFLTQQQSHAQDKVVVWEIAPRMDNNILTGTRYKLFNQTALSYLDYYSRSRGINLAFNRALTIPNIKFIKPANDNTPLKYGDRFAIHVERGGYLYYTSRTYGINLSYSSSPVYQWEFRDQSFVNTPTTPNRNLIPAQVTVALWNSYNRGYLIYGSRRWGPNLTWATTVVPSQPSQVNVFLRTGPYPFGSTSGKCTSPISWTFTPIRLTGSAGRDFQFTVSKSYEVAESNLGPSEWWCIFTELVGNIRAGDWKIRVQTPLWSTECQVTINQGNSRVNFTQTRSNCSTGLNFP